MNRKLEGLILLKSESRSNYGLEVGSVFRIFLVIVKIPYLSLQVYIFYILKEIY